MAKRGSLCSQWHVGGTTPGSGPRELVVEVVNRGAPEPGGKHVSVWASSSASPKKCSAAGMYVSGGSSWTGSRIVHDERRADREAAVAVTSSTGVAPDTQTGCGCLRVAAPYGSIGHVGVRSPRFSGCVACDCLRHGPAGSGWVALQGRQRLGHCPARRESVLSAWTRPEVWVPLMHPSTSSTLP